QFQGHRSIALMRRRDHLRPEVGADRMAGATYEIVLHLDGVAVEPVERFRGRLRGVLLVGDQRVEDEERGAGLAFLESALEQFLADLDGRLTDQRKDGFTISGEGDRKSTRLNSSHVSISYAVFCLKKNK